MTQPPCPVTAHFRFASVVTALFAVTACGGPTTPPTATATAPAAASASAAIAALPDGLVDIGGRRLEIHCTGPGAGPVVVLDAGLGNTHAVWTPVVRIVREFATVCSYDRAGLGTSDLRPPPHGASSAVDDLHALVGAAHLAPPYVVVGASFGGLDAQLFARRFPNEVKGVVFVDAIAPGWDPQLEAILSPEQVAERRAIANGEDLTNEDIRASEASVPDGGPFPEVPTAVLRHGQPFPGGPDWPTGRVEALWTSLQESLAALSPMSTLLVAADSGHRIHTDQPQLVADAIHAILDPSRGPPAAPTPAPAFGTGASPVAAGELPGRFAYASKDGLRIANADGSHSKLVVAAGTFSVGEPSADGTGRLLAYVKRPPPGSDGPTDDAGAEVWIVDLSTRATHRVAPNARAPALAPDGRSVAFTRQGHVWIAAADGSSSRELGAGGCPIWSPDGTRLAECTNDDQPVVVTVADGTIWPVAAGPGPTDPVAWSPDGRSLALFSTRDGNGEIYVVDVDQASPRRVTTASGNQAAVAWTSAGLIVTSSGPGADVSDWFLVDAATGTPRVIPWLRGTPEPIAWLP